MSIKTAHRKVNNFTHGYLKHEGQIFISKKYMRNASLALSNMLKLIAVTKHLTPILINELNISIKMNYGCKFDSKRVK